MVRIHKRILSIILIAFMAIGSCYITVSAESKTANIVGSNVIIREASTIKSKELSKISWKSVTVNFDEVGDSVTAEGKTTNIWYNITYGDITGYVCGIYVSFPPVYEYDANFEKNLKNFPESYHTYLRNLHAKYPNWKFVAHNVNMSFNDAVEAQYGVESVSSTRKWVEFAFGGNEWRDMRGYDEKNDKWVTLENRWTYASRAAIENYMDPRNSLNERDIFVFMQQAYDEKVNTVANLKTVVKGTFLAKGYDGNVNAYLNDIMEASKATGVNPCVLAATIIVEQGVNGTSPLISGTYTEYEGYYNFFNYGASGNNVIVSGLEYAKSREWNSRKAAILGGAAEYSDSYISIGQDTYYYKDFDVVNKKWNHQYATALYDAWTNAYRLQPACITNTKAAFVFKIPVYNDMPKEPCPTPVSAVIPSEPSNPDDSIVATPDETPPTTEPQPETVPEPIILKGDTSGDGLINVVDLAAVKMNILGVKSLEGNAVSAGDINGDGLINVVDLAAIKMHILGVKPIES